MVRAAAKDNTIAAEGNSIGKGEAVVATAVGSRNLADGNDHNVVKSIREPEMCEASYSKNTGGGRDLLLDRHTCM